MYYLIVLLRNVQGVELCARAAIFLLKAHRMSVPLRELRRLLKIRLAGARDAIGYKLAAIRIITKVSEGHKNRYRIPDDGIRKDVFKGLGLGGELAQDLQRKSN